MNLRTDLRQRAEELPPGNYDRCLHIAAAEQIDEMEAQHKAAYQMAEKMRRHFQDVIESISVSVEGTMAPRHSISADDWRKWAECQMEAIKQEYTKEIMKLRGIQS